MVNVILAFLVAKLVLEQQKLYAQLQLMVKDYVLQEELIPEFILVLLIAKHAL